MLSARDLGTNEWRTLRCLTAKAVCCAKLQILDDLEQAKKGTKGCTFKNVKESVSSSLKGSKINLEWVHKGKKSLQARK